MSGGIEEMLADVMIERELEREEGQLYTLPSSDSPLQHQVGGDHYKKYAIQPVEYIVANRMGFCEGNVIKYVTRYQDKNGIEDLKKARHFLDILIDQLETI